MKSNIKNIFLCAGGTGGHIFPAQAVALGLKEKGYNPILITDNRFKDYKIDKKNIDTINLPAKSVQGNILEKLWGLFTLFLSYIKSLFLLNKYKPKVVIGFGGYPSYPTLLASCHLKTIKFIKKNWSIKTIIHESNSVLGKANLMLADKVDLITTSYDEVLKISDKNRSKTSLTGTPVRPAINALKEIDYPELNGHSVLKILVTGGSQGAKIFSDVVPEAIKNLPTEYHKKIFIEQQCKKEDIKLVSEIYNNIFIEYELAEFFTDIPNRIASAHLIISRSGASTLSEITIAGRPVIMVPLPNSKDNHQLLNAKSIEKSKAGWIIEQKDFTSENLSLRIENFLKDPELLIETASKAKDLGQEKATEKIVYLIEKVEKENV